MIAAIIILSILAIIGLIKAIPNLSRYANAKYNFNIFGFGSLSLIPPALAFIGYLATLIKNINYWEALLQKDLDVLVSLGTAGITFICIFVLISDRTNFIVALLTMLLVPPCLFILFLILFLIILGEASQQNYFNR